jgi:hypothetical protein
VVVHALHEEAAGFYGHHGFTRFETAPLSMTCLCRTSGRLWRRVGWIERVSTTYVR